MLLAPEYNSYTLYSLSSLAKDPLVVQEHRNSQGRQLHNSKY